MDAADDLLDADARSPAADANSRIRNRCPCDERNPKTIAVVFIAPKTQLIPPVNCKCYRFTFRVFLDHEDIVPNQSIFAKGNGILGVGYWKETFGGKGNVVRDVDFPDIASHATGGTWGRVVNNHGGLLGGKTGKYGKTDIQLEAGDALNAADMGIVAHSQGANIALMAMQKLCNK